MKELLSVFNRKGQITVPAEIRRALGLKEGDKIAWSLTDLERGELRLRVVRSVAESTFGVVEPRKRPEDFAELRSLFEEGQAAEAMGDILQHGKQKRED